MQRTTENRPLARERRRWGIERIGAPGVITADRPDRLCGSILRALVYYDLFGYPLTAAEVERFIDEPLDDRRMIYDRLTGLMEQGWIAELEGFWYLQDRGEEIVRRRLRMERRGLEMWEVAERFARLMRHVPFVRGVLISGQLSRYVADEKSDIDYFIVAEPNRLWIARTILVLLRRTLLLNNRTWFCTNFFVTSDNLEIDERDVYAACETASVKPLWNREVYRRFMATNEWIREFYPNHTPSPELFIPGVPEHRSHLQRLLESLIPAGAAERLDLRLMLKMREYWNRRYPEMDPGVRRRSLRSTRDESRAHAGDYSPVILAAYRRELERRGIPTKSMARRVDGGE